MSKFSDAEYLSIDYFAKELFRLVEVQKMSAEDAYLHIMHVITAYDRGFEAEFVPYIQMTLAEWLKAGR